MERNRLPLPTSPIVIRDAQVPDAAVIVEMIGRLAAHHGDTPSLSVEGLAQDAFGSPHWVHVLVAEVKGGLAGYTALCGLTQLQAGTRGMDMHHLFVEERFRAQGVGKALVEGAKRKAEALQCRYLMVGTHPENRGAQAFYQAQGFERRNSHPPRFVVRLDD